MKGRVPSTQVLRSLRAMTFGSADNARSLSTITTLRDETQAESKPSYYRAPNPENVFVPRLERRLARAGTPPIGSRRRRVALSQSDGVAFSKLPYQCFQEARQILISDRAEKLQQIKTERERIQRLLSKQTSNEADEGYKQRRLKSMQNHLEKLKILADINDPLIKKRFEDGLGDMSKPIYRYLADRKWREYSRKILVQRITQMKIIPDVVPSMDPVVDVKLAFNRRNIQPGDFVDSSLSETAPRLNVQYFDRGQKLVTVAVVDSDVPNLDRDSFDYRCHFLATNIAVSPTSTLINFARLSAESQIILPWLPAYAHKGSPYHRLSFIILEHKDQIPVDTDVARKHVHREGFTVRTFASRHMMTPIGTTLFRTKWDGNTAGVMERAGIEGAALELKRRKVEPLPYKRRNPSSFR